MLTRYIDDAIIYSRGPDGDDDGGVITIGRYGASDNGDFYVDVAAGPRSSVPSYSDE